MIQNMLIYRDQLRIPEGTCLVLFYLWDSTHIPSDQSQYCSYRPALVIIMIARHTLATIMEELKKNKVYYSQVPELGTWHVRGPHTKVVSREGRSVNLGF